MVTRNPLDNPIWFALTTRQASFAEAAGPAVRFNPAVNLLAGLDKPSPDAFEALAGLLDDNELCGIFLDVEPTLPASLERIDGAPLLQMIHRDPPVQSSTCEDMRVLTIRDVPEMIDLASRTRPGPFVSRTAELGTFLGVREPDGDRRLLAMAGERLRLDGLTEVSGVCTDPSATGRGLAAALVSEIVSRILATGATPFLHVRADNQRAIALYRRLGFEERWRGRYVVVRREQERARLFE